jgi:hypothetical protein
MGNKKPRAGTAPVDDPVATLARLCEEDAQLRERVRAFVALPPEKRAAEIYRTLRKLLASNVRADLVMAVTALLDDEVAAQVRGFAGKPKKKRTSAPRR